MRLPFLIQHGRTHARPDARQQLGLEASLLRVLRLQNLTGRAVAPHAPDAVRVALDRRACYVAAYSLLIDSVMMERAAAMTHS
jgi:hypothetical protein